MRNVFSILLFIILMCFMILFFLVKLYRSVSPIDSFQSTIKKIEEIVPNSETVYYFSNMNISDKFISDEHMARYNDNERDMFFITQFTLAPRIIKKQELENIPTNSYILLIQDKSIDNHNINTIKYFQDCDSIFSNDNSNYFIILLRKTE